MNMILYIEKLTKLGFTLREARVYVSLLNNSSFTATEIAKISNIPRQKIYEILDNIIKKGICIEKVGKVKRYKAVEPEIVFRSIIVQYQENEKIALELSKNLSSLYDKNRERIDPLEYIEILKDAGQINKKWLTFQKNAKHEIIAFSKAPYSAPHNENASIEYDLLKNKVKFRGIYEYNDTIFSEKEGFKLISSLISAGEEARIVKELPMKLAIIDERITMLALNDPISLKPSITTIIINHPSFAMAQKYVFESIWNKALTLEEFKLRKIIK